MPLESKAHGTRCTYMYSHELCVESEAQSMEDSPKDGSLEEVGPKEGSPKEG